jgi:hypothetical protein
MMDIRHFDPEEVARLDMEMWRSYYAKHRLKLFNQLVHLLRRQYHMPVLRSYVVGFHAAKAAFLFKRGARRNDYERALPDLVAYYRAILNDSHAGFDAERAAALELEWWIVHRERLRYPDGELDRALANLAAEVYRLPAHLFDEHARCRAEAMIIRDDAAERGRVTELEWKRIYDLLSLSWHSLWHAVNDIR